MPLAADIDLDDLVRRAGLFALRGSIEAREVTGSDFEMALEETGASVTEEMEKDYEKIQASLKQDAMGADGIGFHVPAAGTPAEA